MISVLVVTAEATELDWMARRHASVEVLTAHGLDDTLEKLGRNRRVDAVLFLDGEDIPAIVEAVREDNPVHPPLFLPAGRPVPEGARPLAAEEPGRLLDLLLAELES